MPISQPLKAPDTDVQLDLISTTGYFGQKHRRPVPISNEGVCPRAASRLLPKGEKK